MSLLRLNPRIRPCLGFLWLSLVSLGLFTQGPLAWAQASNVTLKPGIPVFVDSREDPAVLRAAEDLVRDLGVVLGAPSTIVSTRASIQGKAALVLTTQALAQGAEADPLLSESEAHHLSVVMEGGEARVLLKGADVRGAIYAAYTFSDEVLGIPPLGAWVNWKPALRTSLQLPATWVRSFQAPYVKWRALFPNNTDFWRGWARETGGKIDELLFETMLRLKLNTLDVGEDLVDSKLKPTGRVKGAKARGLLVTSPYLGAFRDWPQGITKASKSFKISNIAGLEEFWGARIKALQSAGIDMVWGVGFRGRKDEGFMDAFPDAPTTPEKQGVVLRDMIQRQLALLRRLTGEAHPNVRTEIYSEVEALYADGHFSPPTDPDLVWNFANESRDHFPSEGMLTRPMAHTRYGYYFNLQFTATGSHYAEGDGPWKLARNLQALESAFKTRPQILKVNSGNLREYLMSLSAYAAYGWDGTLDMEAVLDRIFRRYFGEKGPQVLGLYREMLDAYWQQRAPSTPDFDRQYLFYDLRLAMVVDRFLDLLEQDRQVSNPLDEPDRYRIRPEDCGATSNTKALVAGAGRSAVLHGDLLRRANALSDTLDPLSRAAFDDVILTPTSVLHALEMAASQLGCAVLLTPPRLEPDSGALDYLTEASVALQTLESTFTRAERAPFQGWYSNLEIQDLRSHAKRAAQLVVKAGP